MAERPARFVVAVGSGKGGVGKSTVALNLALALIEQGRSVGILDADVYGPDIPRMVNLMRRESAPHWDLARAQKREIEPIEEFGVKIVSSGFIIGESHPLAWSSGMVSALLWQFLSQVRWGDLDYLLVDLPPGTADLQQSLARMYSLSGAIVVVTPQDVAHLDAKKVVSMFRTDGIRILGGVENMSGMRCPHCDETIDVFPRVDEARSIWAMDVRKLGDVPMDPVVSFAGDDGKPLMVAHPDSAPAEAFRHIARVVDLLV